MVGSRRNLGEGRERGGGTSCVATSSARFVARSWCCWGVLAFLTLSAATASADVSFNVQGKWTCNNRGKVIPIAGARVELWRDISYWPDDEIGAIHTASDGSFNFGVRAGSNFDLYVKLILTDDRGAHLGEWYSFSD